MEFLSKAYPYLPLIVVAIIVLIFCLIIFLIFTLRRAKNVETLDLSVDPSAEPKDATKAKEPSSAPSQYAHGRGLRASFSRAIRFLRERVAGRDYLYQIPWYMVVGEAQSGKTTLLDNAGIRAALNEGEEDFGIHQAIEWRFLNQGIILDVYGNYVLRSDDVPTDDRGWVSLLKQLQSHRARRPLDGIIITLPCTDFLSSSAVNIPALETKAARLSEKLWHAEKILGLCLPVYVIVTKCDAITGFRGFAREIPAKNRQDIFGWSSPYNLATSFIPKWVDEAFESLGNDLSQLQSEIFAVRGGLRNADDIFLFPGEFEAMRQPLRVFLSRLFKETAYRESFYFRGIYFCGDAASEEPEPDLPAVASTEVPDPWAIPAAETPALPPSGTRHPRKRTLYFLARLFEEKIFPESGIARPISSAYRTKSQLVLVAQATSLVLAIGLGLGMWLSYRRMKAAKERPLLPTLQHIAQVMSGAPPVRGGASADLGQSACDLVRNMEQLDMNAFSSVFIPISHFSSLKQQVTAAMVPAFEKEVLTAVKNQLDQRTSELIGDTAPVTPAFSASPMFPQSVEELRIYSIEKTPEFQALLAFTNNLRMLQENVDRYEALRRPRRGSEAELRGLTSYLKCPLKENFDYEHNPYFHNVLSEATGEPFNEGRYQGRMTVKMAQLVQNLFDAWFVQNPLLYTLSTLQLKIESLESRQFHTYKDLKDLDDSISQVRLLLSSPAYTWLTKPNFELSGPVYQVTIAPLQNSKFLAPQMETDIRTTAGVDYQTLKSRLREIGTDLTGNLLQWDNGVIQLSPAVLTLQLDLENVLNLPFMTMEPTRTMRTDLEPGTRLMWNPERLNEALALHEDYDRFIEEGLRDSPSNLRSTFRRVTLLRLESNMLDLIGQAQNFQPASVSSATGLSPGGDISPELKNFEEAEGPLSQLLEVSRKLGLSGPYANLLRLTTSQAVSLLEGIDRELSAGEPYAVKDDNFFWWHGEDSPALKAFDLHSPEELEGYLTFERERVKSFATQAEPLIKFLQARRTTLSEGQARTFFKWRQIVTELKRYDEKIPGTSVAAVQDFIRTDMNKFSPDKYCQGVPVGFSEIVSNDYFIQKRDSLRRGIYERCKYLADMAAFRNYTDVAKLFDHTLAGRFPFALSGTEDYSNEADPESVLAFYRLFDQHESATHEALRLTSRFGPSRALALSFLEQMETLRSVFASYLAGGDEAHVLSFDFVPHFRVNLAKEINGNQIIDWTLIVGRDQFRYHNPERAGRWQFGDPMRLSLRWAKDSPAIPVLGKDQSNLKVEGRDAIFEFTDAWSLFTLLQKQRAPVVDFPRLVDPRPYTLEFNLGTIEDLSTASKKSIVVPTETKVFVQLSVMLPGKKDSLLIPSFPGKAPLLIQTGNDE